ncbi:MAG: CotH kinase family protein [Saprospiraceae bacterium]
MKNTLLLFLALFSFLATPSSAQIQINEYSAANLENFLDDYGRTEDWIELYNSSPVDENIGGWYLSDKDDNPQKWEIPAGTVIPANGHLVFWCSGRDRAVDGNYHTNFKLAQTKGNEFVSLAQPSGIVVDLFQIEYTLVEHSRCRTEDGDTTWKISTAPTPGASNNASPQIDGYTSAPSMDLAAGFHNGSQTVTITNNEANSVLRYTTDGTNPTTDSDEYSGPITFDETTVIKAQSFSNDPLILPGRMDFNTYFIDEDFSLAVFSVAADEVINLANGDGDLIPIGSLEYFNTDKEREATSFGSLNRHGQDSWVLDHRSLDWISRDEMGYSKSVDAPLFSYSDRDEYQKFMFRNSGDDNYPAINDAAHEGSCHIRDEYIHTLAQNGEMKLDVRAVERVVLFLNGEYWGVYGMRERPVDHDYTDEYYDQGKYDVQYLSTWGDTEIEYGGLAARDQWINFRDWVLENDMSDEDNYETVTDSLNVLSMIDYMIVNLNTVASDWLNYNTGWWRGRNPEGDHKKWGYILWDLDATFDYYINYSGVPNISPDAEPCDLEDIGDFMDDFFDNDDPLPNPADCNSIATGASPYTAEDTIFQWVVNIDPWCCNNGWDNQCQNEYDAFADGSVAPPLPPVQGDVGRHEKIFFKLLEENSTFKQLYYSRQADMMNTVFSCENMITTLDEMLAVIEPEMPRQIDRWGGTMTEWESNVQDMKDFILERCEFLDEGMLNCYDELSGPYELTLQVWPPGVGEIDFNTLDIEEFPWTGTYFGGMENNIKAKVFSDFEDDHEFSHWETQNGNVIFPDEFERKATFTMTQSDTLTAVFTGGPSTTKNLEKNIALEVFPNPAKNNLTVSYDLEKSGFVTIELQSILGNKIMDFTEASGSKSTGAHRVNLSLTERDIADGIYLLVLRVDGGQAVKKISILK